MLDIDDIDDDFFDDDELDAYFQAHGLSDIEEVRPHPHKSVSSQRQRQHQQYKVPPPSAQQQHEPSLGEKDFSRWKGKGKAVDPDVGELADYFPPSGQRERGSDHRLGLNSGWEGKGKAKAVEKAYGQGDVLGLDKDSVAAGLVISDTRPGNSAGFGRGDVLGLDGPAPGPGPGSAGLRRDGVRDGGNRVRKVRDWLGREDEDEDGDDEREAASLDKSSRPRRVNNPNSSLGSSPPVLSGLSIRPASQTKPFKGQTESAKQLNDEGQTRPASQAKPTTEAGDDGKDKQEGAAPVPLIDPYDSEASIAARPIVSHDPDHPDRPIDMDVKAARGVIRYALEKEKFPEVWPIPQTEAAEPIAVVSGAAGPAGPSGPAGPAGPAGAIDAAAGAAANGLEKEGTEGVVGGRNPVEGAQKAGGGNPVVEGVVAKGGDGAVKRKMRIKGKMRIKSKEEAEREAAEKERVEKEKEKEKAVVMPKGVVMLVKGIQYLKMPLDTSVGSEVGSEYGYEDEEPRAYDGHKGVDEKMPDEESGSEYGSVIHVKTYNENGGNHKEEGLEEEEIPETDLDSITNDSDSDVRMSNTDYLPPPSSQVQSQPFLLPHKRSWSQRHDHAHDDHPSPSPSSPSLPSFSSPFIDPYALPPPRPPSPSPSFPSQPPIGPPDLLIRLILYDGEFWVQAILRPEFHHLVLGHDFDEWLSETDSEDERKRGRGGKPGESAGRLVVGKGEGEGGNKRGLIVGAGDEKKGKGGKEKTPQEIAKEEEEKEAEEQEKWQRKWEEKARGDVREGVYVRLVGDVVVEFEEVDVEVDLAPVKPPGDGGGVTGGDKGVSGVSASKEEGKKHAPGKSAGVGANTGKANEVKHNHRGGQISILDDGIGDPEKLEKLRTEAMERKGLGKGKETEGELAKAENAGDNKAEDEAPKTTKMVCLVVGHMVPVGYDRKFMREMDKSVLKAMAKELGPVFEVASITGDEMDLDGKDDKSKKKKEEAEKKKEPEKPKPWWVETGYRAELEEREKRRREEAQRLEREAKKMNADEDSIKAQKAKPSGPQLPDPRIHLPPEWVGKDIFEVDALIREWEKKNKPKAPKPPKPPRPEKKPIITARQAPQFRSSITAQEIFQLQNPDRKPVKAPAVPAYKPLETRVLREQILNRPVAIEQNQQIQRRILELPQKRTRPRPQQEPVPQPRPHLQPNPLLQPPQARPQVQVQPRPQPDPGARPVPRPQPQAQPQVRAHLQPHPQLQPQPLPRPHPQPQLPPQPPARPHFQQEAQTRPQFIQQQQPPPRPQLQPQHQLPRQPPAQSQPHAQPHPQPQQPRLPPQPPPPIDPPKPNPHLATDPTIPLKLCPLRQIPHLPYAQNWMINVLAIIVSVSDVEPSHIPPTFTQRIVRLADQSTSKHILLNVFLDAEDFTPKPGEVVLLMGVKNHRFEGGSLKKYWSDRPPEGARWKSWWVGEEVLGEIGWCKGMVEGLRGWWREKEGGKEERKGKVEMEGEGGVGC